MARTATDTRLFETRIDLGEDARKELVALLNGQLADNFDLHAQTKQAHWNVKGIHFQQLHELFDELAGSIEGFTDEIAERVTALGGYAEGTARMAAHASTLPEFPTAATDGKAHLEAVCERWVAYAASTRSGIERSQQLGDEGTGDLLIEIVRTVDKGIYFLEAHLRG